MILVPETLEDRWGAKCLQPGCKWVYVAHWIEIRERYDLGPGWCDITIRYQCTSCGVMAEAEYIWMVDCPRWPNGEHGSDETWREWLESAIPF